MNVETIVEPSDARLKDYQGVSDPALLRERGLFVAEGRLVVERVLVSGQYVVDSLLLNQASLDSLRPALESAAAAGASCPVFLCDTSMFELTTGFNIHRGCLALVRRPPDAPWQQLAARARLIVVLEGVTNADNVGSVFRNAAAFGADAVLLSPTTCDPLYRKATRTAMGATLNVPFSRLESLPHTLTMLKDQGFTIAALSLRQPSRPIESFISNISVQERIVLLIGTEGNGLTSGAETAADICVRIPITAQVDSLNVSVASGIALSMVAFALGVPKLR